MADGSERPCAVVLADDLGAIVTWGMALEREVKAACLALGWSKETCEAEP